MRPGDIDSPRTPAIPVQPLAARLAALEEETSTTEAAPATAAPADTDRVATTRPAIPTRVAPPLAGGAPSATPAIPEADVRAAAERIRSLARWPRSTSDQQEIATIVSSFPVQALDRLMRFRLDSDVRVSDRLLDVIDDEPSRARIARALTRLPRDVYPLFNIFPGLVYGAPRLDLATDPTPVARMSALERDVGTGAELYIKHDDASSPLYGGNKVRKLEFTYADMLRNPPSEVIAGGGTGSNMTVAAAAFGQQLGIPVTTFHFDQPNTEHVRQNLKLDHAFGAEMHYSGNQVFWAIKMFFTFAWRWLCALVTGSPRPRLIMPGDSNGLSSLGYVSAAFELRDQIRRGEVPEPDYIFVAAGSCGTAAGLIAGLRLAGLRTRVVCVRVASGLFSTPGAVAGTANDALDEIRARSFGTVPDVHVREDDVVMLDNYYGDGYGASTPEGTAAIERLSRTEGVQLDGTYTGKAMAAMLDFARQPAQRGRRIMFWNTLNSVDMTRHTENVSAQDLPEDFQHLFPGN